MLEYHISEWMYRMGLLNTVRSNKTFLSKIREAIGSEVKLKKISDKKAFESFASVIRKAGIQADEISYLLACYCKAGKEMETLSEEMIFSEDPNNLCKFYKDMEKLDEAIKIKWKKPKKILP